MKWIRHVCLGLSVAALSLSMAACGDQQSVSSPGVSSGDTPPNAYILYAQAFEKSMAEERLSYFAEINMEMQAASVSANGTVTMDFAHILSGNDPRIRMDQTTTMRMTVLSAEEGQEGAGQGAEEQQTIKQMVYYADGMWYEAVGDEKFRQKVELAQAEELVDKNSGLLEIPENAFQDAAVTGTNEVGYTVTATLSAAVIREELLGQVTAVPEQFQELFETMLDSLAITNPSFQFTVDAEGHLSSYSLAYEISIDTGEVGEEGAPVIVLLKQGSTISNFQYGKQVRVVEPENLDTYPEPARQLTEEEQKEIVDALTNDDGSPVENFNEVYKQLVEKYGQSTMKAFFSEK